MLAKWLGERVRDRVRVGVRVRVRVGAREWTHSHCLKYYVQQTK